MARGLTEVSGLAKRGRRLKQKNKEIIHCCLDPSRRGKEAIYFTVKLHVLSDDKAGERGPETL